MIVSQEYRPGKWMAEVYREGRPIRAADGSCAIVTGANREAVTAEARRRYGE